MEDYNILILFILVFVLAIVCLISCTNIIRLNKKIKSLENKLMAHIIYCDILYDKLTNLEKGNKSNDKDI